MVLLIDNYDSFTYNLYDYILQLGMDCTVIRNNEMSADETAGLQFTSAVISPGPKTPQQAGITLPFIQKYYATVPILGICLGHQAIGEFFGAKLIKAEQPMHGKTSLISHNNHFLFKNIPEPVEVMRYHSLVLSGIDKTPLQVTATSAENEVMALAHPQYRLAGVQFHPEAILTTYGIQILRNWFNHIV